MPFGGAKIQKYQKIRKSFQRKYQKIRKSFQRKYQKIRKSFQRKYQKIRKSFRSVRAKDLKLQTKHKAFAPTGCKADCAYTQGVTLGQELLGLQPVWRKVSKVPLHRPCGTSRVSCRSFLLWISSLCSHLPCICR